MNLLYYGNLTGLNYKSNTRRREIVYVVKIYFAYVLEIDNKMIAEVYNIWEKIRIVGCLSYPN